MDVARPRRGELIVAAEAHRILRRRLPAAAAAPFILVWVAIRDQALSFIHRPGEPSGEVSLRFGWIGALLGAVERRRKSPGVP